MNRTSLHFAWLLLLPLVTGCPPKAEPAPRVLSFTVSAPRVPVGSAVTLSWKTENASTVEVFDGSGTALGGVDNQPSGSVEVTVTSGSLFVLSARAGSGVRDTAAVAVEVANAKSVLFTAAPPVIDSGSDVVLAWSAPGARAVSIKPSSGAALDLKGQLTHGSLAVRPEQDTTYELSADGVTRTVEVGVRPAILGLSSNPTYASPGTTVTLSWVTKGAKKLVLSVAGRGTVATIDEPAKVAAGTSTDQLPPALDPSGVVTYVLRAEGTLPDSVSTRTVELYVGTTPKITSFVVPEYARTGGKFRAEWATTGADRVEISAGGTVLYRSPSPATAVAGWTELTSPSATTEYTLAAIDSRGGRVTQAKSTSPVGATSLTSFTATPTTVANGGDAVTLSWNVPGARRLRIEALGDQVAATASGPTAETGTVTVHPNGATTDYVLSAHNTLGDSVTSTKQVTVTAPAVFTGPSGPVFSGGTVSLAFSAGGTGASIQGMAHGDVTTQANSTGFVDISSDGTKLAFTSSADDSILFFVPDFDGYLYGEPQKGPVAVSTNGFLALASAATSRPTPSPLPSTVERNFIAPFWTNLIFGPESAIYWKVVGEAPEKTLVVQWHKVRIKTETDSRLTFQAQLHQSGVVRFEYETLDHKGVTSPVIGIQASPTQFVVHGSAPAKSSVTFFGPKASPVSLPMPVAGPHVGFIKIGSAYLRVTYTAATFVRGTDLSISEVLYQPAAAIASTGEWFEVRNDTQTALDLVGWTLDFGGGNTHTVATANGTTVVPANGMLVFGQSPAGSTNDGVAVGYVYGTGLSLAEPAGSVALRATGFSTSTAWNSAQPGQGGPGVSLNKDPGPYLLSTDTSGTAPHALSCSGTTPFGSQAPQQLGSPGASKSCFGYALKSIPVSYFDISGNGTALFAADMDEDIAQLSLAGAPFPYHGVNQTQLSVSTNGYVAFKSMACSTPGSCYYTNKKIPTATDPFGMAAIFWDDLDASSAVGSNVFSKRVAAGEDPANPGAHWLIQWHHYSHFAVDDDLNMQMKLFDTGVIEFHYQTMTSSTASNYGDGNSATVWLDNAAGTTALSITADTGTPAIRPNTAYRLTPQ